MSVFKACDIRGRFPEELNEELYYRIGRAARVISDSPHWEREVVLLAGDVRRSTPALMESLKRGLVESGASVIDLGIVPTPVAFFAKRKLGVHGLFIVTASHNPPEYNGLKLMLGQLPVLEGEVEKLSRAVTSVPAPARSPGLLRKVPVLKHYTDWLRTRFSSLNTHLREKPIRVVVDAGNGCYSRIAPDIFSMLSIDVEPLFCEESGEFPGRPPNPAIPENLSGLSRLVPEKKADFGVAFDGDGDRVAFVDERGRVLEPEQSILILMRRVMAGTSSQKFVYDQKCSDILRKECKRLGGVAIEEKSGHGYIKWRMIEEDALFGAEVSGHYFYKELSGADDGLFTALLFSELLTEERKRLSEIVDALPPYFITPDIRIHLASDEVREIVEKVKGAFSQENLSIIDGVKVRTQDGWGLVRPSITEPLITLRFEAHQAPAIPDVIKEALSSVPELRDKVLEILHRKGRP